MSQRRGTRGVVCWPHCRPFCTDVLLSSIACKKKKQNEYIITSSKSNNSSSSSRRQQCSKPAARAAATTQNTDRSDHEMTIEGEGEKERKGVKMREEARDRRCDEHHVPKEHLQNLKILQGLL